MLYIDPNHMWLATQDLFPEALTDAPGRWSHCDHLAQDTRCRRCRGRGETG